ncbi:Polyisoprenoid-binding protein YceI [Novosphingobium sp. CF614]|uniref:YceI family protein n=1 Tax=Novosphingobium sp. CF614 TaxID=1884364 RepID=UPI0008EF7849|nr:YceI family protein [Novosphingobium sp. CF614]SFG49710.1 Polyisoprenoid-binding protein YceI [Novosphingobium sp. CF614]
MRNKLSFAAALALAGISAAVAGQTSDAIVRKPTEVHAGIYVLDPAHGKITWSVDHLGFSTYVGQFTDMSATLTLDPRTPSAGRLQARVGTESVGTFNEALDRHIKTADFLDTAKFPTARFIATGIRLTDADSAEINGNLTLRGVTKPIVILADFHQAGTNPIDGRYSVGFDGHARIKRSEFGVSYGLPAVGDDVTLHFEAEFKLQPGSAATTGDQ